MRVCICCGRQFEPIESWERDLLFPTCTDCVKAIDESWDSFDAYVEALRATVGAKGPHRQGEGRGDGD